MYTHHPIKQKTPLKKPKRSRLSRLVTYLVVIFVVILGIQIATSHSSSAIPEIKSGITGFCLDDHRSLNRQNNEVDSWGCNGTQAQDWVVSGNDIIRDQNFCLSVANNGSSAGDKIVSATCGKQSGQVWVSAIDGYENPGSALCLDDPGSRTGVQLELGSCSDLTLANEAWQPAVYGKNNKVGASLACNGNEGQLVACTAAKQWALWNSGTINHNTLLSDYSENNGYEEWCADFVSYAYKTAGYPFKYGERAGWDEYLSYDIQNMGVFTYHVAGSGYIPRAGDVAYFDYNGGHVEIVAIGGQKPIFIYGDSGRVDPQTQNGDMAENTITNDGFAGQVEYYLSPS
jgi:hypothetical protein